MVEEEIEKLLSQAWLQWQGTKEHKPDFDKADTLFKRACSEGGGLAYFWYYQFLSSQKRYEEAGCALDLSVEDNFLPAYIRIVRDICNSTGYGKLQPELLEKMRLAGEEGFLRGRYLYLQNNTTGLHPIGIIKRLMAIQKLKKEITQRIEKSGWSDRSIWG